MPGDDEQRPALPPMLTPEQVAEYLGVHYATVLRLLRAGEMPGRMVGRQWRVPLDKLREWAEGT